MEMLDVMKVDVKILELSEKLQKVLVRSQEPSVLSGIKRELAYWREQKKMMSAKNTYKQAC